MKAFFLFLFCIAAASDSFAQIGTGYQFTYDGAGYRIQREFLTSVSYLKKGNHSGLEVEKFKIELVKFVDTYLSQ